MRLKCYAKAAVLACQSFVLFIAIIPASKALPLAGAALGFLGLIVAVMAWGEAKYVRSAQRAKRAPFTTVEDGKESE